MLRGLVLYLSPERAVQDCMHSKGTKTPPPERDAKHSEQHVVARNAGIVAGATLLSRILGFLRDCIIAGVLGAGPLADAFFVAFRAPNLLRRLFGEGSLTIALVSEIAVRKKQQGLDAAFVTARSCLLWLLIILGGACVLAHYNADVLTAMLAPGFLDSPELFARTASLVQLCFPYALLICIVALCMGLLNALGHFLMPALAPCVLNCCLIIGGVFAWLTGLPVPETLGVSLLVAGVLQVCLQLPAMRAQGFSFFSSASLFNDGAARVGKTMLPTLFGAAAYQIGIVLTTLMASFLPSGSIAQLYFADRIVQFPLGVFGMAVGTAALPSLAALAAEGNEKAFTETLGTSIRLTLFVALPATAGLLGMTEPIVRLLFERGAFTQADTLGTMYALQAYAVGLPAFSMIRPLLAGFHARQNTRSPVVAALIGLSVMLMLGGLLMFPLGHVGLAAAVSAGAWANAFGLWWLLARQKQCVEIVTGTIVCYLALSLLVFMCSRVVVGWTHAGGLALCAIPCIAVVYGGVAWLLRSPDIRLLLKFRKR